MGPAHQLSGLGGHQVLAQFPYFLFPEQGGVTCLIHLPLPSLVMSCINSPLPNTAHCQAAQGSGLLLSLTHPFSVADCAIPCFEAGGAPVSCVCRSMGIRDSSHPVLGTPADTSLLQGPQAPG